MDLGRDLPALIGLATAVLLAIFLAAAETALLRVPGVRAATLAATDGRGERLHALVQRLPAVLNTVLLAALLSQIVAATLAGVLAQRWFGNLGVTVASVTLSIILYIYGEAIPKTYAVRHTDAVALRVALPVALLERVLRPVVTVLVWLADLQMPGKGVTTSPTVTEDELRYLADLAATEGEITPEDRRLIERAFRIGDRQANDIMVPRPDIVAVEADASIDEAMEAAMFHGHRRLPVTEGGIDNVIGMVRLRDLVRHRGESGMVRPLVREVLVVPESKRILDILVAMQEQRRHLAVVVDEYGGTAGLITIEDIAEELLGTLSEDGDHEPVRGVGGGWSIDASLLVEDLAELIGSVPEGDWNTAAGLFMGLSGTVPELGDEVTVNGFTLRVSGIRGRRITRIEIRPAGGD